MLAFQSFCGEGAGAVLPVRLISTQRFFPVSYLIFHRAPVEARHVSAILRPTRPSSCDIEIDH